MFITYLHTKFHKPSSNDSIIITIKPKAKCKFCVCHNVLYWGRWG